MAAHSPPRTRTILLLAIAAMVGCIIFAGVRLTYVDGYLRRLGTENYLWFMSQAQFQSVRLAESLVRQAAGDNVPEDESPQRRLEILRSQLGLFLEGPPRRILKVTGSEATMDAIIQALDLLELRLNDPISGPEALRIRGEVAEHASMLRDISNKIVWHDQEQITVASEMHRRIVVESLTVVLVAFMSTLVAVMHLFRGIRETQRAERLLRQEQRFSDLVVNLSNQGIIILDEQLRCLLWNPGMEAVLGVEASNVVGQSLPAAVPLFASPSLCAALQQAVSGRSSTLEEESGFPDGPQERCLEISCHPLQMAERDLAIAFVRDVTERWQSRRQAEQQNVALEITVQQRTEALKKAESRLLAAIRTAPDGFAAFDTNGKLLIANERIRSLHPLVECYRDDMSLAAFLSCLALCEGADERLLTAARSFEPLELDLRLQGDAWAHLSVTRADHGTVFVRLTDVTPYKKAAQALQSALDRERQTTSAYRSFVSMISHQFRTPLAIIDSSAQRLLRRGLQIQEEELEARVSKIRGAITRLTRLVESVLNAARIDAGQIEFTPRVYDLLELVSDICERQREVSPNVNVRLVAPDLPVHVTCDIILIEQVVSNLLSNAVKYSRSAAAVEVRLWIDGDHVKCSVRDWGVGIPADELPRIFDRFYRARTASGIAGTGIGLDVARQIMQMHDGTIKAESREGEGSIFTFTMPITRAATAPQAA